MLLSSQIVGFFDQEFIQRRLLDHSKDRHPRHKTLVEIVVLQHALPCINLPKVAE